MPGAAERAHTLHLDCASSSWGHFANVLMFLEIVLLVLMATMQLQDYHQIVKMVYEPSLTIWGSQEPYKTRQRDGRFPEEVNHKENNGAVTCLTPENDCEHLFTEINYLFLF
ncbi:neuronal regeneration-related protein isoform X2 [Ascaphus truei]|uniref:neuronal regeneration-related protein isoform X2 n=1 Tax=Ascaphus truei TaxID=8439 RepID=UPI003F5A2A2C